MASSEHHQEYTSDTLTLRVLLLVCTAASIGPIRQLRSSLAFLV